MALGTAKKIFGGVVSGWGKSVRSSDAETLHRARHHIFTFSAAKSYHQLQEIRAALYDQDDQIIPYTQFRKRVGEIADKYNELWLEAEYQAAKRSAIMARQWETIQEEADIFPFLKYITAGDDRVRISHRELEGITLPVNDPFWQSFYPPNGWNCRCSVEQIMASEPVELSSSQESIRLAEASTPPYWKRNVAIDNIFPAAENGYYDALPTTELEAVKHYGLRPSGQIIKSDRTLSLSKGEVWSRENQQIKITWNKGQADILILDPSGNRIDGLQSADGNIIDRYRKGILIEK